VVARAFDCPLVQPISELADRSAYDLPSLSCRIDFTVGGEGGAGGRSEHDGQVSA